MRQSWKVCKQCTWWYRPVGIQTPNDGICRRYPPIPMLVPHPKGQTILSGQNPLTAADFFCGEWSLAGSNSDVGLISDESKT